MARMRVSVPRIGLWVIVAQLVLIASVLPAVPNAGAAGEPSVVYTIEPQAYNNSIRVGSTFDILYPRIAAGPSATNASQENVYVLGLSTDSCPLGGSNLVVIRSVDGGHSFEPPRATSSCLPGLYTDALVASDGVIFVALSGPTILRSKDDGLNWTTTHAIPDEAWYTSLAWDGATGSLHLVWSNPHAYLPYEPPIFRSASSADEGGTWSSPVDIPVDSTNLSAPQVAASGDRVVIAYLRQDEGSSYVCAISSNDGGLTWSAESRITPIGVMWQVSGPSIAVSPDGVFAITWYEDTRDLRHGTGRVWDDWGNSTETFASFSVDRGATWSAPVHVGGPPGWVGYTTGGAAVFDAEGRLFVTWHSIGVNWSASQVYVATSDRDLEHFNASSFSTLLEVGGGNSTQQENLAAGPSGRVHLVWDAFDDPTRPRLPEGIYVRTVTGAAEGSIQGPAADGSLELRDSASNAIVARFAWRGTPVAITELPPERYAVWFDLGLGLVRAGDIPIASWGRTIFTVFPSGSPSSERPLTGPFPWFITGLLLTGVGIASVGVLLLQYTRIRKEDTLQRKVRQLLYEYVREHSGSSFSQVRDAIGLRNGAAAYHLGVLERQGFLHSEKRRRGRWYYPNGDARLWRDLPLSPLQVSIVDAIRASPGIGVREIARTLDGRVSSIADNVKALTREGILRTERDGHRLRCFAAEGAANS